MKVTVDPQRCQGHNRCCAIAPELFEADELGHARTLNDGEVPVHLTHKAQLAIDNCPEFAIAMLGDAEPEP